MRNNWFIFFKLMLIGAGLFWIPDIIVHAVIQKNYETFFGIYVLIATILLPILCLRGFLFYCRQKDAVTSPLWLALAMAVGIWVLGPTAMMISLSFTGAKLWPMSPEIPFIEQIGTLTGMTPVTSVAMSTYDGTPFALSIVIIALPICGAFLACKRIAKRTPIQGLN